MSICVSMIAGAPSVKSSQDVQAEFSLKDKLCQHWRQYCRGDLSGWTPDGLLSADITIHKSCIVTGNQGQRSLRSQACGGTNDASAQFVLVSYQTEGNNTVENFAAKIKMFVTLKPQFYFPELQELNLAVADLFRAEATTDGENRVFNRLLNVNDLRQADYEDYPVKVQDLKEVLTVCFPRNTSRGFFIPDDPDEDF